MTANTDRVCAAHRDLIHAERRLIPPDPIVTLPTQAAQLREDMPPTKGTEE